MTYNVLSTPTPSPSSLSFSRSTMSFWTSSPPPTTVTTLRKFEPQMETILIPRSPSPWPSSVISMMFGKGCTWRITPLFVFFFLFLSFYFYFFLFLDSRFSKAFFSFLDVHLRNGTNLQAHYFVLTKHQTNKKEVFGFKFW